MAKRPARQFACRACGAVYPKWMGQCEACGEWNTLEEIAVEPLAASSPRASSKGRRVKLEGLEGMAAPPPRIQTSIAELDRVLGGGLVPASVVLVGGDPGIGKSTLLLQAACKLAAKSERILYISGEEAVDQIRLRALRLGVGQATLDLAASINVADIVATLEAEPDVRVVVIDSIQTMWLETVESAPGSVSQVRACAFELIRLAKRKGFSLILVGHVTKEGALAGPRVLEHMVDAVMYFEGDRGHQFRILRAAKNRFGATDEIGVFAMTDRGLEEVSNPSALFLAERRGNIAGSAVFAGLEGTRPVLLEVQALLAPKSGDNAPPPCRSRLG
ncbi:DNA repair protein RadA [Acetobacter malorum]|uniref:DNA repair protein RadA n=1 Tax=Acetobacter malorum TaxID=178901 RepID=A0A177G9G4_9PROT|nr:DNA repair protein RadA [Acetobacter malorum]